MKNVIAPTPSTALDPFPHHVPFVNFSFSRAKPYTFLRESVSFICFFFSEVKKMRRRWLGLDISKILVVVIAESVFFGGEF